jgi:TPR repeat protein
MTAHEAGAHDREEQQLLVDARALRRRGEYDEAVNLCTRLLRRNPEHADALSLLGDIYRELGNFREALGWYQLAVKHGPGRVSDQQRLDEMIDRVFPGTGKAERAALAATPSRPVTARLRDGALRVLQRVQPIHVMIVFALLAMGIVFAALAKPDHPRVAKAANTKTRRVTQAPAGTGTAANSAVSTTYAQSPAGSPPPPDGTEEDPTAAMPSQLRNAVRQDPRYQPPASTGAADPRNPRPIATTGTPAPGGSTGTAAASGVAPVSPLPPISPTPQQPSTALSAADLERMTTQLRVVMERAIKETKLRISVDNIVPDPRTGNVMVDYTVPPMANAVETKKGLLYAGFTLIWAAQRDGAPAQLYTLRGYATVPGGRASLGLLADVTAQQADASRSASTYALVERNLTRAWWRDDLQQTSLAGQ